MENLTVDELINNATKIIVQEGHTIDDIKILSKIRYFLSIAYKRTNTLWSSQEWLYNSERASKTVALQETLPVWKAENQAKAEAETSYWKYRETNAEAQGISKILDTIEWFIIGRQVENKSLNETKF